MIIDVYLCSLASQNDWHLLEAATGGKETPTQLFSCEFFEVSKKTFSKEHLETTASDLRLKWLPDLDISIIL